MKRLTKQQFFGRLKAIQKAKKIFMESGLTNNISTAFEIYQSLLAEEHRDIFLNTYAFSRNKLRSWIDTNYIRPICPDCANRGIKRVPLYLRVINIPQGPRNIHGYKTAWICVHNDCIYESYSKKNVKEWMDTLETKNGIKEIKKKHVKDEGR